MKFSFHARTNRVLLILLLVNVMVILTTNAPAGVTGFVIAGAGKP